MLPENRNKEKGSVRLIRVVSSMLYVPVVIIQIAIYIVNLIVWHISLQYVKKCHFTLTPTVC